MHQLLLHPDSNRGAVAGVDVDVSRSNDILTLRYVLTGSIGDLCLPPPTTPARADELWRSTCFEAFVAGDAGYLELNFAPSRRWAAYRFDGYRAGMRDLALDAPDILVHRKENGFELTASMPLALTGSARLNLTAVIEESSGGKSYWALAHPSEGPPDFHHPDCFVLELPPASGA